MHVKRIALLRQGQPFDQMSLWCVWIFAIVLISVPISPADDPKMQTDYLMLFDEACGIIEHNFYDAEFIKMHFDSIRKKYIRDIRFVSDNSDFSFLMNRMLSDLNVSHTAYYTPKDVLYYHLASVFNNLPAIQNLFNRQEVKYPSVGFFTEHIENDIFITSVLPGGPAEKAGLLRGDEIVSVDGETYRAIESLKAFIDKKVKFTIRRKKGEKPFILEVQPVLINPHKEMLEAEAKSIRLIDKDGLKIGYIHMWSYAGEAFHQLFIKAITWGKLKHADALIWDLRYGLGGANPDYLNFLNTNVPVVAFTDRDGNTSTSDSQWRKPLVMLVNKTVRSGKEILAFGLKHYGLGAIIGENTAGECIGGKLFLISNGDLLYLAVSTAEINGVNLEGHGVAPDIWVREDIRYCSGHDLQLDRAIEHIVQTVRNKG